MPFRGRPRFRAECRVLFRSRLWNFRQPTLEIGSDAGEFRSIFTAEAEAAKGWPGVLELGRRHFSNRMQGLVFLRRWEFQPEARAGAGTALDFDDAVVFLDDAIGHRQSQARAFADALGREEGIVDPRDVIRRYALAGVGHL